MFLFNIFDCIIRYKFIHFDTRIKDNFISSSLRLFLRLILEAEHGYAVSVPSMFGSGFGGGGVESSSSLTSDDHVVPTANNCRGLTGPTTMMIPINNKGAGGGGSNVLAFNGKFNQTNTTNNSHHVLGN